MPYPNFETLRQVAECANGMRDQSDMCFVIRGNTFEMVATPDPIPAPTEDEVYIPVRAVPDSPFYVRQATISGPGTLVPVNLLDVSIPAIGAYPALSGVKADAVFFNLSAVEKFLLPYYASVYGDQAPTIVAQVKEILEPVPSGFQPYAVIHLPSSEYALVAADSVSTLPDSNPASTKDVVGEITTASRRPGAREYFDDLFLLAGPHAVPLTRDWKTHLASIPASDAPPAAQPRPVAAAA
ncbi:MAG TPA: hypothetical protein VFS20_26085 [Longimicrobium sp.]|nr:hypothetical protein [Longimicrobium sp.]